MNVKIKDLSDEALEYTCRVADYGIDGIQAFNQIHLKKFSSLLIEECVNVIMNSDDRHRKEYFAGLLKDHFEVKE